MISHSFLKFLDIYFEWVRFVARRRCLCAYFPRVYSLRVVAQWGCSGVARIRQVMTFPGLKSIFHLRPMIRGLLEQVLQLTSIHQTKVPQETAERICRREMGVHRLHRRVLRPLLRRQHLEIHVQIHQADIFTEVRHLRSIKANRLQCRQILLLARHPLFTPRLQILPIR